MKIYFIYLSIILSLNYTFGQDKTPFNDYWKVGLTGMYISPSVSNNANSLDFEIENLNTISYGLKYNFYQFESYNLSVSLQGYNFKEKYKYNLKEEDYPAENTVALANSYQKKEMLHFTLNLIMDRYFPVKNNYFMIGAGPEIRVVQNFRSLTTAGYAPVDDMQNETVFLEAYLRSEEFIHVGIRADAGFGLASNIGLFELRLHGHLGFNDFIKGTVMVDNLLVSPSSTTDFTVSGNYFGVGLSYYPKRKTVKMKE